VVQFDFENDERLRMKRRKK